jgi:hypothetical protein
MYDIEWIIILELHVYIIIYLQGLFCLNKTFFFNDEQFLWARNSFEAPYLIFFILHKCIQKATTPNSVIDNLFMCAKYKYTNNIIYLE